MTKGRVDALPPEAAIGLSVNVALDKEARRSIVFQTHVPQTATEADINKLLDLAFEVTDRQADAYYLVELVHRIDEQEKLIRHMGEDIIRLDKMVVETHEALRRRGDPRPNPQEKRQRDEAVIRLQRAKEEAEFMKLWANRIRERLGKECLYKLNK